MTTQKETIKQISGRSGISEKLIRAVLAQLGGGDDARQSCRNIANHGADRGFVGFTYCADTVAFYRRHRAEILALAERMADDCGEDMIEMIRNFGCLSSGQYPNRKSDVATSEVAEALYLGKGKMATQIQNAMAWFAAEEVARAVVND